MSIKNMFSNLRSFDPKQIFNKEYMMMFVLKNKALILMIFMLVLSIVLTNGTTLSSYNTSSLLRQLSVFTIISIGFTVILASGQIDLSIGDILSLSGVVYATIALSYGIIAGIIAAFLVAVFAEFFNGFVIRLFRIPGFVLTLATGQMFRGLTHLITDGGNISGLTPAIKWFGQGKIFGFIPVPFLIAVIVVIVIAILINKTIIGRHIIATGGNGDAAQVSGINVEKIRILSYAIAGACVGVGAVVLTGRLGFAAPNAGDSYVLDCIAAVVIGGTAMHGGKAKVVGTLFGVTLIIVINNMLNLLGVSTYFQWIAKGAIIVIAIVLDSMAEKFVNRQRTKKEV